MNDKIRDAAIVVIKKLMTHPVCNDFIDPFQPGEQQLDGIEGPQDLTTVKNKLENNAYKTVNEWIADVDCIWNNADIYYKGEDLGAPCVEVARHLFGKYRRKVDALCLGTWCGEVYRLRSRLFNLMATQHVPSKVKSIIKEGDVPSVKENMPRFTETELAKLAKASEALTSPEEQAEMLKIIDDHQPDLDSGDDRITLDVRNLQPTTAYALRHYIKMALEKKGEKYPE